ncbi:MAG: O-antigen ligase family protein [Syntrophales bacterium]|nr:O-antigen ligase family protein [Syntrophales bacterium]
MDLKEHIVDKRWPSSLQTCMRVLVALQIILIPYPKITAVHEICFYSSFLLFIILLISKKLKFSLRTPLSIPMGLFVLWSFIGLFFALNLPNSIHDIYAHLLKYLFTFYLTIFFLSDRKYFTLLIWGIIVSTTLFGIGLMVNYYIILGNPLTKKLLSHMAGEVSTNIIAIITLFSAGLCIYLITESISWYRKAILSCCLTVLMITTLVTQSRSALLAMCILLVLAFRANKKVVLSVGIAIVMCIALTPAKNRFSPQAILEKLHSDDRINIWYDYWEIIKDHPIVGVGFGMQTFYDVALMKKYNARVPEAYRNKDIYEAPHNAIMDLAARTGLVGLTLFLSIIVFFIRMVLLITQRGRDTFNRHWASCLLATFAAVFIQGLFESTMSGPPAMILFAIFSMAMILWNDEQLNKVTHAKT